MSPAPRSGSACRSPRCPQRSSVAGRVLMRRGHPAAAAFGLEVWLAHPHVLVSGQGATRGALDEALARLGRSRRVGVVVPSFLLVPPLLAGSDLIALLPGRTLPADPQGRFVDFAPPIPVPGFPLHLAWHARRDRDVAVRHVAALVQAVLAEGGDKPGGHR